MLNKTQHSSDDTLKFYFILFSNILYFCDKIRMKNL
jgi:hypothetical protein